MAGGHTDLRKLKEDLPHWEACIPLAGWSAQVWAEATRQIIAELEDTISEEAHESPGLASQTEDHGEVAEVP